MPSTRDRRKDADKHVIQRVRQADVVVQLDIDQVAELRKVDVAAPVLVRPPEEVVHAIII